MTEPISNEELVELGHSLDKNKCNGEDALKILKILLTKAVTAAQLKDKVIARRLLSVSEDYADDKTLGENIRNLKSTLKKRWNSVHN